MKKPLQIVMFVSLWCASAHASSGASEPLGQIDGVDVYDTGLRIQSAPGQSLGVWLASENTSVMPWTDKTHWEACANICYSATSRTFVAQFHTVKSSLMCAPLGGCPEGFEKVGLVHTHPNHEVVAPTTVDLHVNPDLPALVWVSPQFLSPEDLSKGEIWMWTSDGRTHHADASRGIGQHSHSIWSATTLCPDHNPQFAMKEIP